MRNATRLAYNAYLGQIAKLNGVASAVESFAATPSVQQRLESRIQESSDFLRLINLYPVTEMAGETIGLDVTGPIAGRTDTSGSDRATRDVSALDNRGYTCSKTNYDTHLTYAKLDAWAKFPDFQARIRNAIVRRQALDRIMIGWNGTSIAANSNLTTNPLLQDVNIGWLQKMRAENSARVMTGGATAGTIKVGTGGTHDYASLDALVYDLVNNMIDPWYREDSGLRVILGRDLLADKYFPLLQSTTIANTPSETIAADMVISQKRVGGVQAVTVPFFPAGKLLITTLSNLSIYYQEGARRRYVQDNPKRDRIENYESSNDAYVVEELGLAAMAENITLV